MAARKTEGVLAVCLLAVFAHGSVGEASVPFRRAETGCVAAAPSPRPLQSHQASAVARTGTIPGLGAVSGAIGWDNRTQLTLSGRGFQVARTATPLTGEVEITIAGSGEEPLTIRLGGAERLVVTRGGKTIRWTADVGSDTGADPAAEEETMRALVAGRAVGAFRDRIGQYERELMSRSSGPRVEDPHADGFLLVGAFIASMAGDRHALGRARDLIMQRVRGGSRRVGFQFKDCVSDYERYLINIDDQRTYCLDAAEDRYTWYGRAADRLGCELEFMAQALSGEGQFVSCTALGALPA